MKVRPLFDKVVVESLETEEKTKSGIRYDNATGDVWSMKPVRRYDKDRKVRVWKDGEHRHTIILHAGARIRKINPDMSADDILYYLVCEWLKYYDQWNTDLTRKYGTWEFVGVFAAVMAVDTDTVKPDKRKTYTHNLESMTAEENRKARPTISADSRMKALVVLVSGAHSISEARRRIEYSDRFCDSRISDKRLAAAMNGGERPESKKDKNNRIVRQCCKGMTSRKTSWLYLHCVEAGFDGSRSTFERILNQLKNGELN